MTRGIRSIRLAYKSESLIVDMPGWYAVGSNEGVHSTEDMALSDCALAELKVRADRQRAVDEAAS